MQKDYEMIRGQSKSWTIKFKNGNGVYDITDYKIFLTIKSKIDMTDEQAEVSKDITITNPELGIATVTLESTECSDLAGTYYYDIKYVNADQIPKAYTILIGQMEFAKSVTIREA